MINPELRRNLWLEFSLHRVIAVPAFIALVILLILTIGGKDPYGTIAGFASMGYAAIVLLWGTQLAGMSVLDESQERTWDAQRMSAIGPWAMTWGKLLGAPSFTWYGGTILLVIYVVAGWTTLKYPMLKLATAMIVSGLMLHAIALSGSVIATRKGIARRGIGLLVLMLVLFAVLIPASRLTNHFDETIRWWRTSFGVADFVLASVFAYAAWAVLGAYRAMCNELEIRTMPWALPAFITFSAMYIAGFAANNHSGDSFAGVFLAGVMLSTGFAYLMLFSEPSGAAVWQRMCARARAAQWIRASQELPLWTVALATGLAFATGLAIVTGLVFTTAAIFAPYPFSSSDSSRTIGLAPLALILYAIRDAAILQFFALARRPKRVETATLFYLVMLYLLLPGLLSGMSLDTVSSIVRPAITGNIAYTVAILLVQVGIAIALAWWRFRTIHAADTAAPLDSRS
jgi:hypothetical protein